MKTKIVFKERPSAARCKVCRSFFARWKKDKGTPVVCVPCQRHAEIVRLLQSIADGLRFNGFASLLTGIVTSSGERLLKKEPPPAMQYGASPSSFPALKRAKKR